MKNNKISNLSKPSQALKPSTSPKTAITTPENKETEKPKESLAFKKIQLPKDVSQKEFIKKKNTEDFIKIKDSLKGNENHSVEELAKKAEPSLAKSSFENKKQERKLTTELATLTAKGFDFYGTRFTLNRSHLFYEMPEATDNSSVLTKAKSWMGISSGTAPFQPNFSSNTITSSALASVNQFASENSNFQLQGGIAMPIDPNQPTGTPPPNSTEKKLTTTEPITRLNKGKTFSFGFKLGRAVTKNIAIESGIQYIQQEASISTNVFSFDKASGNVVSFYQNFLSKDPTFANTVVTSQERLTNTYEYVVIPLQMAYQIPIWKQLSASAFVGTSADVFLKNRIETSATESSDLTADNSHFRRISMSGLGGIRLNYLFSKKWQLSVGSTFRQSLNSKLKIGNASIRPQSVGLSYGVNYLF